jgi:WD40 repeat protein
MYKLSRVIQAHKRDVRCLDYHDGVLVTGGNDKTFSLFAFTGGNSTLISSSDIFDSEVIAIKINRYEKQSAFFIVLGCRNGKIYAFDRAGNPTL